MSRESGTVSRKARVGNRKPFLAFRDARQVPCWSYLNPEASILEDTARTWPESSAHRNCTAKIATIAKGIAKTIA